MYGCEIVWSAPIGRAASSYARSRSFSGTKSSRGTRSIAASTRSSTTSLPRSWASTIRLLASAVGSGGTRERTGVCGRRDAEMLQHGGRDLHDRLRLRIDPDRQHRDLRVAAPQRAVTPSAGVMTAGEVGELESGRGGDDHLAGVGIVERSPRTLEAARIPEQVLVPAGGPRT